MTDTITTYAGGEEKVALIIAAPDPREPGRFLIKNQEGSPLRGKLSLGDHAYNVVLLPDSFIMIDADETELFKDSRSDDRVIFVVPTDKPEEFYVEKYITGQGQAPYTALILRRRAPYAMISAVLYPRDLTELPQPLFMMAGGSVIPAVWKEKSKLDGEAAKKEQVHSSHDLDRIMRAVRQQDRKPVIDPNAPKKEWF